MSVLPVHDFRQKLAQGEFYEAILDDFYSQWYFISPCSLDAQKTGIDRSWIRKATSIRYAVEYKSDEVATRTGNIFIETKSRDSDNKPGWAYSSIAQLLIYYLPLEHKIYETAMLSVKNRLQDWKDKYVEKEVVNKNYNTRGVLVPRSEFEKICYVVTLPVKESP